MGQSVREGSQGKSQECLAAAIVSRHEMSGDDVKG